MPTARSSGPNSGSFGPNWVYILCWNSGPKPNPGSFLNDTRNPNPIPKNNTIHQKNADVPEVNRRVSSPVSQAIPLGLGLRLGQGCRLELRKPRFRKPETGSVVPLQGFDPQECGVGRQQIRKPLENFIPWEYGLRKIELNANPKLHCFHEVG